MKLNITVNGPETIDMNDRTVAKILHLNKRTIDWFYSDDGPHKDMTLEAAIEQALKLLHPRKSGGVKKLRDPMLVGVMEAWETLDERHRRIAWMAAVPSAAIPSAEQPQNPMITYKPLACKEGRQFNTFTLKRMHSKTRTATRLISTPIRKRGQK